jgi:glycosyltransferase involved in cell wall biosynthesis
VASDVGGVAEAVSHGETGYLVRCGDLSTFRARLSALIENPTLRGQMGAAGRKRYEAEFRLETMLARTLVVYREIVPGQSSAAPLSRSAAVSRAS